jgi:hypothetical protein
MFVPIASDNLLAQIGRFALVFGDAFTTGILSLPVSSTHPPPAPTLRAPAFARLSPRQRARMSGRPERVTALHVVYDADGTRVGELLYMIRKLLGIAHCAACDITHGPRTEKPAFTRLKTVGWSVPLLNIHRDEMDKALAGAVGKVLPVVAARTADGRDVVLLGPRQLEECCGDVGALEAAINAALAGAALVTPPFPPQPAPQEPAQQDGLQLSQPQPQLHTHQSRKARLDVSLAPGRDVLEDGAVPIFDENQNRSRHTPAPLVADTVGLENMTSSSGDESVASLSFAALADTASVIAAACFHSYRPAKHFASQRPSCQAQIFRSDGFHKHPVWRAHD